MSNFNEAIITNAGKKLISQIVGDNKKVKFSKVVASDKDYSNLNKDQIAEMTNIESIKQENNVNSYNAVGESTISIPIRFDNLSVNNDFLIKTIGIFAKDESNAEYLYSVITANRPQLQTAYDGISPTTLKINSYTEVGNSENVTVEINLMDNVTFTDLDNNTNAINKSISTKVNNSDFNSFKSDNTSKLNNKADKSELKNYAKQSDLNEVEENVNKNINDDSSPINQKISNLQNDKASHDDLNQTKNNLQGNINDKADKSYVDTNLATKATIEQAQYNYSKVLTNNDDFYNLSKGHHIVSGATPKNAPYKTIYGDVYVNEHNTFLVDNIENFYYLPDDHSRGWTQIVNSRSNQSITGSKNFTNGLKISDKNLYVKDSKLYYEDKPVLVANAPNAPKLIINIDMQTNSIQYQILPPKTNGGAEITGYVIYWKKESENNWQSKELEKDDLLGNIKADKSTEYDMKVVAKNYAGNSVESEIYSILSADVPRFKNLKLNYEYPNKINVSTEFDDNGSTINSYTIFYRKTNETNWTSFITNSSNSSFQGDDGNEYEVKIKANNNLGWSEESPVKTETILKGFYIFNQKTVYIPNNSSPLPSNIIVDNNINPSFYSPLNLEGLNIKVTISKEIVYKNNSSYFYSSTGNSSNGNGYLVRGTELTFNNIKIGQSYSISSLLKNNYENLKLVVTDTNNISSNFNTYFYYEAVESYYYYIVLNSIQIV